MEADIIVEGFSNGKSMPPIYCLEIRKIECANHIIENVSKHLHELSKESSVQTKLLPSNRISHIGRTCRKLITLHSELPEPCASTLMDDVLNAVNHVNGDHAKCKRTYCLKVGQYLETNFHKAPTATRLLVMRIMENFCSKANSLVTYPTTNRVHAPSRQVQ
ncbi:hypothetical protein JTB14_034263 [Gonioctena quinquepunctata]|nr:hypothetical protein JTB14_034263 [Gonioctena quinquepunctata]